jgi:hypothetical protein
MTISHTQLLIINFTMKIEFACLEYAHQYSF